MRGDDPDPGDLEERWLRGLSTRVRNAQKRSLNYKEQEQQNIKKNLNRAWQSTCVRSTVCWEENQA